jgi:hypothetical protein
LSEIGAHTWRKTYEKTVETKSSETNWTIYEKYRLLGTEGSRYIRAPEKGTDFLNRVTRHINPLAPEYAGLFLRFARWFDEQKMDEAADVGSGLTLDTPRNGDAALEWAHQYGVLGLGRGYTESFAVVGFSPNSSYIAAERLGMPDLGLPRVRAYSKGRDGGKHETVEGFVLEAYEANLILKLYEAATAPTVDALSLVRFMPKYDVPPEFWRVATPTRERYSGDADDARCWALAVVEDAVTRKVEHDVYPILLGKPGAYMEGWGFKSLLAAMWYQMRNFMLGEDNKCERCGRMFHKTRRDKRYCSEECGNRARASRGYERKKQHQQQAREATKRRLQR